MTLDRIATLEVFSVLAHDWGLYGLNTRLHKMGFKPSLLLRRETLDPEQDMYLSEIESHPEIRFELEHLDSAYAERPISGRLLAIVRSRI